MSVLMSVVRRRLSALVAVAGLGVLAGCSGVTYAETPLPTTSPSKPSSSAPAVAAPTCDNATQSYDPLPSLPSRAAISDASMRKIIDKGYLTVGISADTYLFGARNAFTGGIEGFDIDMARAVAKAIFGDPNKVQLRVITAGDRIPLLKSREVDMVARNMSMTCDRWQKIAFSAEYYRSGQKTLVPLNAKETSVKQLSGKTICAPAGSTSLTNLIKENPAVKPITADSDTGCLVLFQQGKAYGISGDDTVLAGDAAQDPYAKVLTAERFSEEPYGLGIKKGNVDFVKFVNGVLAQMKSSGAWMESYNAWLMPDLGKLTTPPPAVYGRTQ